MVQESVVTTTQTDKLSKIVLLVEGVMDGWMDGVVVTFPSVEDTKPKVRQYEALNVVSLVPFPEPPGLQ